MKGFKLDQNGDVVITDGKIEMVEDIVLIAQTLRQVIGTNLGEWLFDEDEGIDFYTILTKNPNNDLIQDTIKTAVQHAAEILGVEIETGDFAFEIDKKNRSMTIDFPFTVEGVGSSSVSITL